jgi:hypothetical protein
VNLEELRIAPNKTPDEITVFEGQNLREVQISITGCTAEVFEENTLVVFPVDVDWEKFLRGDHHSDLKLIHQLSQTVEQAMDIIRFYFCRIDLPDFLPGPVGTWNQATGFSGVLLYNGVDNESHIIAGMVLTHLVVVGVGLELNEQQIQVLEQCNLLNSVGEVGSITRLGLTLFSGVLESNSATTKFISAMNLLEYLAFPYDFKKFEKVKKEIICHIAKSRQEYDHLSKRFIELTGKKDESSSKILGYRTRVVHLGEKLEEILPDERELSKLFLELQKYIGTVLSEMIMKSEISWDNFLAYRDLLKEKIGVKV